MGGFILSTRVGISGKRSDIKEHSIDKHLDMLFLKDNDELEKK